MVFEVPKAPANRKKFEFELDGKSYAIPLLKFLKPSIAAQMIELGDLLGMKLVLDTFADGSFDDFSDTEQLNLFIAAWREASGIGLGESSASSDS